MQETCDISEAVQTKKQSEPYILLHGDYKDPSQAFLITDCHAVCEIEVKDIPVTLLCAFFVFNICYTKGCVNVYKFLEHSVLSMAHKKLPPTVDHFLASLHSHCM